MYVPAWPGLNPSHLLPWEAARRPGPPPFPFSAPNRTYSYVARNLIYHLFRALGLRDGAAVLVPDYHHGNEVRAIRAAGTPIRFYPIHRSLVPDLDELARLCGSGARALYVIHYLGWPQPMEEIAGLCRKHGLILIEDCALSLLSESGGRPLGTFGDYAVFCLYKTLPLPHGGLLVQNGVPLDGLARLDQAPCSLPSLAGRSAELILEWTRSRWNPLGRALFSLKRGAGQILRALRVEREAVGNEGFDPAEADTGMSPLCHRLLERMEYETIRRRRRQNFLLMQERLESRATPLLRTLEEGICPLFYPILVPDKASAAQALWRRGIQAVQFWNAGDPGAETPGLQEARFLRQHVLELPIHQDVTVSQVDYMADQVLTLGLPR